MERPSSAARIEPSPDVERLQAPSPDGLEKGEQEKSRARWRILLPAAAVVLVFAALAWKFAPRLFTKTRQVAAPKAFAVIEIENLTQDPSLEWMDNGVVELLTTDLAQAKQLDVLSSERIRGLIRRRVKGEARLPADEARDIAQDAHADWFLSGALLKVGTGLRLDLRVQDTASGKLLYAGKVEGENPQAVFAMVDKATAGILSELAPGEAAASSAVVLTSNIEALHAYEEGLQYFDRFLEDKALGSFRRAVELDPQFAMAHFQSANALVSSDLPGARKEAAHAVDLSARLPRQQQLAIEANRLGLDGRFEEADQILETARREFPRDIEVRSDLAGNLLFQWRFSDAIAPLEEILRLDDRQPGAYLSLTYSYAWQGDVQKALTAVDKYAALEPPNDPNPIGTRGDVFSINGRFEEALPLYQRNRELNPGFVTEVDIPLCYLYEGKYSLAEASAETLLRKGPPRMRALAAGILGDVNVAGGRLDRAVPFYEEGIRALRVQETPRSQILAHKAAQTYIEQGEPQAALELGRRIPAPWGASVRGIAFLLLKNDAAAEKEFTAAREGIAPYYGDYEASQFVETDRWLAAAYAGRWQEVISGWPRIVGPARGAFAVYAGRAYFETGNRDEAEKLLRFAIRAQHMWLNEGFIAAHNSLSYSLAQFYLAKLLEQEGKKAEAINSYQEFLSHFENSNARLPQIAEARAAVNRLM